MVRCEPTNGGFAGQPKPNNDGGVVPLKVTGNLTLADTRTLEGGVVMLRYTR